MSGKEKLLENISMEDIWLDSDDFSRQCEFLLGAYFRLENDFLEYLEYVPYREDHLNVSSSRLADFILRIPPLLAISFRLLTFGNIMKGSYERWIYDPHLRNKEKEIRTYIEKIKRLYIKKEKYMDSLNDYYELHILNIFTMWRDESLIDKKLMLINEVGKIEFPNKIYPFKKENWFSWKDLRNNIEHRGKTEAALEDALYGIAFLLILIIQLYGWKDAFFEFNSNLFEIGWIFGEGI